VHIKSLHIIIPQALRRLRAMDVPKKKGIGILFVELFKWAA